MNRSRSVSTALLAIAASLVTACGTPRPAGATQSPDPAARINNVLSDFDSGDQNRLRLYEQTHGAPIDAIEKDGGGGVLLYADGQVLPSAAAKEDVYGRFSFNEWDLHGPWGAFEDWSIQQAAERGEGPSVVEPVRAALEKYPVATWLTDPQWSIETASQRSRSAANANAHPIFTIYYAPNRDCGGHSSGGAPDIATYEKFNTDIASATANGPAALIVIEPDLLGFLAQGNCSMAEETAVLDMLRNAVEVYKKANPDTLAYYSVSNWGNALDPNDRNANMLIDKQVDYLNQLGVGAPGMADGFALDVAGGRSDADSAMLGEQIAQRLDREAAYVIESARNGRGEQQQTFDDPNRAIGDPPGPASLGPHNAGRLWIKPPTELDGPLTPPIQACVNEAGQVCFTNTERLIRNRPDRRPVDGHFTDRGLLLNFKEGPQLNLVTR